MKLQILIFTSALLFNACNTEQKDLFIIATTTKVEAPNKMGHYSTQIDIGFLIDLDSSGSYSSLFFSDVGPRDVYYGKYQINDDTLILKDTFVKINHQYYGTPEEYEKRSNKSWKYPTLTIDTFYFWLVNNEYHLYHEKQTDDIEQPLLLEKLITKDSVSFQPDFSSLK